MMNIEPAVHVNGLSKRFGNFIAVNRVDLSVANGEVFGLLGANGAGKTTVIRMLCGTLSPDEGEMSVAGIDMIRQPRRARSRIGYVTQGFTLYGDMTVRENLELQAGLYGLDRKATTQRIEWALSYLELSAHALLGAHELPLGYQRRLSLAAALLHEPKVLFLDEPTSGVDPLARQHFWELIYNLADSGIAILVTTHYMDEAAFCDRLALMHAGRMVEQETPENLLARPLTTPIVELQAQRCEECVPWITHWATVHEVIPHAGHLRIRLKAGTDIDEFMNSVRSSAGEYSVEITSLHPAPPMLEDIFVAVLEQAGEVH